MPQSPTSRMVARGNEQTMGEWVAQSTWEPAAYSSFSTPTRARLDENDKADSGSSRQ